MDSGIGKCTDRISSLPDCLLSHILSFLPTKYAVGTSILSKRWKVLWTYIPTLDFDDAELFGSFNEHKLKEVDTEFAYFVSQVFLRSHAPCLKKFRLNIMSLPASELVDSWISLAVKRNVQELKISNSHEYNALLPDMLFYSKTLVVLKLFGVVFEVPDTVWLPSLKFADLAVENENEDSLEKFLSGCPVLEDLNIRRTDFVDQQILSISVPTLKRLQVDCDGLEMEAYRYEYPQDQWCRVVIDAPKLEYLEFSDYYLDEFCFKNLPSLAKAFIDVGRIDPGPDSSSDEGLPIYSLLSGVSNVKFLCARCFFHNDVNNYKLPTFSNLAKLTLGGDSFSCWNLKLVGDFLQCSPNLEVLILERNRHSSWKPPEEVPNCLLSRLKKIEIELCTGEDYELDMIEYLLKNAKVLKKMKVDCRDADARFSDALTGFPRGSDVCQLYLRY